MVDPIVHNNSSAEAKIALFRSLFRGREDVYPRRFESRKSGKAGYQPACANEWVRGLCDKRKVKCVQCPNQRFLPVTDEVVRRHLSGQDEAGREFVMGSTPCCWMRAVSACRRFRQGKLARRRGSLPGNVPPFAGAGGPGAVTFR